MVASVPASMLNQNTSDLGIPNRIDLKTSRFRRFPERYSSAEHVAGKGVVPAFRFTRSTAAHLGAFVHFTDRCMRGSDRPGERLVSGGVALCCVWGEEPVTRVVNVLGARPGSVSYGA